MFVKPHIQSSIRFRYWRRKGFAAFRSVGKHITIGNLKNIVADTLLGKQNNTFDITVFVRKFQLQECDTASQTIGEQLQSEFMLMPVLQQSSNSKIENQKRSFNTFYRAESRILKSLSAFLLIKKTTHEERICNSIGFHAIYYKHHCPGNRFGPCNCNGIAK